MNRKFELVALLPMKANSERVVGKNFKNFCGKPLFRWMLDNLLEIDRVDAVVINTDAEQLLREHGLPDDPRIMIHDRPKEICGDLVSMNRIIENDLSRIDSNYFLMTHTTNPLLTTRSIESALDLYLGSREYDSAFSVNRIQTRFYDRHATAINHDPANLLRTQDLTPWFEENSNFYLFSPESFAKTNARIGQRPLMVETEPFESTDIDTPADWELAEVLVDYYRRKGKIA